MADLSWHAFHTTDHGQPLDYSSPSAMAMKAFIETVGPIQHQLISYNYFITEGIRSVMDEYRHLVVTHKEVTYEIKFGDYVLKPPVHRENSGKYINLTPKVCLDRGMTYASDFQIHFSVKMPRSSVFEEKGPVSLGSIPVMVMSSLCRLSAIQHDPDAMIALGEDVYEHGGYLIIEGKPYVVGTREQMITNRIYTFYQSKSGSLHGEVHNTPMDGRRETIFKTDLIHSTLMCTLPYIKIEFPVSIIFHVLGIHSPAMMLHFILPNEYYVSIPGLLDLTSEVLEKTLEKSLFVTTEEEAWAYIGKIGKKYVVHDSDESMETHRLSVLEHAQRLIDYDLFPHMGQGPPYRMAKAYFLGLFLRQILFAAVGHKPMSDDRDHMANKTLISPGMALTSLFGQVFGSFVTHIRKAIIKSIDNKDSINIKGLISEKKIEPFFLQAIKNNRWILNKDKIAGLSQSYDAFNYVAGLQCGRRVVKFLKKDSGLSEKPRDLHNSQYQVLCPSSTPEGKKIGFICEYSSVGTTTMGEPGRPMAELIQRLPIVHTMAVCMEHPELLQYTPIMVNSAIVGTTAVPETLVDSLRHLKRSGNLHPETCIVYQKDDREIHIRTDANRAIRPCFVVSADQRLVFHDLVVPPEQNPWIYYTTHGAIEWLSKDEEEQVVIAVCEDDLKPGITAFDYCELGPENMYGIGASTIPFPEHNAAPRNSFQVSMGKQAIGIPGTNAFMHTTGATYILNYPQKPLAYTRNAELVHLTDCPSGTNTIMMVCPLEGFNQEDSLVLNLASSQLGYGDFTMLKSFKAVERPDHKEKLEIPTRETCSNFHGNTSKLDSQRFHVLRGQRVEKGDVLIGMVSRHDESPKSISVKYEHELPGTVFRVIITHNKQGYKVVHVMVAQYRPLECSDKMSLPCGNKGTISMKYNPADLPQTLSGLIPEILINPLAFPSRMSFSIFFEGLTGRKVCAKLRGLSMDEVFRKSRDATPFQKGVTMERLMAHLHEAGIPKFSEERVIDGRTGELTAVPVFVGINHYQRLKHLGIDKINCLTMDHEVLTDQGWKFFPEITMSDKIATLKDGKLVYDHPLDLFYYPDYEGPFYEIKYQCLNLKVTLNHRMYVAPYKGRERIGKKKGPFIWDDYQLIEAKDLVGKRVKYKRNAVWDVPDYQFILPSFVNGQGTYFPEKALDMDAWLTFLGIWFGDGWCTETIESRTKKPTKTQKVIIASHKQRIQDCIFDVLEKLGVHGTHDTVNHKIVIVNKQLFNYMGPLSVGAPHKAYPDWIWKLSQRQCQFFIEKLMLADGNIDRGRMSYYTSSVKMADQFVRLCLHAGWSATKTKFAEKGEITSYINGNKIQCNYDHWRVRVVIRNEPQVNLWKKYKNQVEQVTIEKQPVFCLSVPSEVFYVRRGQYVAWTGNSRGRGQRDRLTQQPVEGRSHLGGQRAGHYEVDLFAANGCSAILKDRMMDQSDASVLCVCKLCGLPALHIRAQDHSASPERYYCNVCDTDQVVYCKIPYATKLYIQEMMAMGIAYRLIPQSSKYVVMDDDDSIVGEIMMIV